MFTFIRLCSVFFLTISHLEPPSFSWRLFALLIVRTSLSGTLPVAGARCPVPSAQCDTIECRNKSNARPKNEQQNIKRSDTKSKTNLKWKLLPTQILQGAQDNLRGHTPTHPSLPTHPSPHTITTHNTRIGMPSVRLWVAGLRVSNKCHDMKFIYAPRKPMKSNQSKGMQQQRKNRTATITAAITRASNAITMPQPKTIKRE